MKNSHKLSKLLKIDLLVFLLLFLLALILFLPVVNKPLASDDYQVMYRLVYEGEFFIKGFFRPVSDFTLYFSYLLGGFNPISYNLFNLLLHTACAFLLYKLSYRLDLFQRDKLAFAWICALLFITYPFRNESIIWGVGRASIVACFFSFLSLYVVYTNLREKAKYILACVFYFIGLCSYETIIVLPFIALILLYQSKNRSRSFLIKLGIGYFITIGLNLLIRYYVSGVISGSYGSRLFDFQAILHKIAKGFGRMFLPPSDNSQALTLLFIVMAFVFLLVGYFIYRFRKKYWSSLLLGGAVFLISLTIPALFGVSTKTIEGDRLLYFPSFFLCLLVGFLLVLIKQKRMRVILLTSILFYNVYFLQCSNQIWRKAGIITSEVIDAVRKYKKPNVSLVLLNIPEEYKGAQVFRNGFKEALFISGIDTSGILLYTTISSDYYDRPNSQVIPSYSNGRYSIYPNTIIKENQIIIGEISAKKEKVITIDSQSQILYWTGEAMQPLLKISTPF